MKQCCSISDVLHQLHYFRQQYKLILNFLALLFSADNLKLLWHWLCLM